MSRPLRIATAPPSRSASRDTAATASFLADITISFNNFGLSQADQVRKTFYELYANLKVGYITAKVDESAGDWANF